MQIKISNGLHAQLIELSDPVDEVIKLTPLYVAYGLSNVSRYNGQHPFSPNVCQHSVTVANFAKFYENSPRVIAASLWHDSQEMLLGDVSSPVKQEMRDECGCGFFPPNGSAFDEIESRWQREIFNHFLGFWPSRAEWKLVKKYDNMAFAYELGQWVNNEAPAAPVFYYAKTKENHRIEFLQLHDSLVKQLAK